MKKCYLAIALLCMTFSVFAQQTPRLQLKDIAQNPALMTPELALTLSKKGIDKDGYLPPVALQSYNLRDSSYYSNWEPVLGQWSLSEKTHYINDCTIGKPILRLTERKHPVTVNYENVSKTNYTYFPDGAEKKLETAVWRPSSNDWLNTGYRSYVRPNDIEESWSKSWDETTNHYYNGFRSVYEYDDDEQLIKIENYELNSDFDFWIPLNTTILSYLNGKIVLEQSGGLNTGAWVPSNQIVNTYDSNGNLISTSYENGSGQNWSQYQLITYTYDASNKLVEKLDQYKNGNVLINDTKTVYTYYTNNQTKYEGGYIWLPIQQTWLLNFEDSLTETGHLIYMTGKFSYDENQGLFHYGSRTTYTYDSNDLAIENLTETLVNPSLDDWENFEKDLFTYDANGSLLSFTRTLWDETEMAFVNDYQYDYFNTGCLYSDVENTDQQAVICKYANPIVPGQPINCSAFENNGEQTLSLYSMTGQKVHEQSFQSGESLQPSQALAPGMYVLTIVGDNGVNYRSKVVVQ